MTVLLFAALVADLGIRPAALTGPDPQVYSAKLAGYARALAQQASGVRCEDAEVRSDKGSAVALPALERDGVSGANVQAVWDEHLTVSGCGRTMRVKMYVARRGEDWAVAPLPPGTGVVGNRLAHDVMPAAVSSAVLQMPPLECRLEERGPSTRLADTELTSSYAPGKPWTERWTFTVCGQPRPVEITFTPAADGGTDYRLKGR